MRRRRIFSALTNMEGFIGGPIGDPAQWRPVPAVRLQKRDGEALLLWSWSPSGQPDEDFKQEDDPGFYTTARPIDRRRLERLKWAANEGSRVDRDLAALASVPGLQLQTVSRRSEGGRGLLDDFLNLETATDRQIVAFARRWGPLRLCNHGKPLTHNAPGLPDYDPKNRCVSVRFSGTWFCERLADWRRWSREAADILAGVAAAKTGVNTRGRPRSMFEMVSRVNQLLVEGGAILAVEMDPQTPNELMISVNEGAGVFGLIGLQLASTLMRSAAPTTCSACGRSFFAERPAPTGKRRYCAKCRCNGASLRDASRDSYRRSKRRRKAVAHLDGKPQG